MDGPLVWMVLAQAPGVGRVRLVSLMAACPDPAEAWRMSVEQLCEIEGWNRQLAGSAAATRRDREAVRLAEQDWERAWKAGLDMVLYTDAHYPAPLRRTPAPPPYFYQAGPWRPDDRPVVAIVGTRKATSYGLSAAHRFAYELAAAGVAVVSGMARGIDCAAHRGALEAGGVTLAVLGGGADVCYPREAATLYRSIRSTGAVISEQAPGAPPRREFFPERNRIISGLADATLVVEAGEKSGTLITVDQALNQGRDVFAIPGPITSPVSLGPHQLIRDGATLVASPRQMLEDMGLLRPESARRERPVRELPEPERQILGWMGQEPRWAGDLAEYSGRSVGEVQGILTMLELKGLARRLPGGQYIRVG